VNVWSENFFLSAAKPESKGSLPENLGQVTIMQKTYAIKLDKLSI
jgi:hypothetical protein